MGKLKERSLEDLLERGAQVFERVKRKLGQLENKAI